MTGAADLPVAERVPLAGRTSLGLGGDARWWVEASDEDAVRRALAWADARGRRAVVLGGGTNVLVPDAGVDALVIAIASRGRRVEDRGGGAVRVVVQAGEPWDPFVAWTVVEGLAGLECLSGIPGLVGATPIQNVGAYGVEIAERIERVRVLDRRADVVRELDVEECAFAYRDSRFRRRPEDFVVLGVTLRLERGGRPTLRYAELERAATEAGATTLSGVRDLVLALRAKKSMLLGRPGDPNGRSVGSFFLNPIVSSSLAERVVETAVASGLAPAAADVPRWPAGPGRSKLAAAWLIERAGFRKGLRRGPVGISTRHALALVHLGGGTTGELLDLAQEIAHGVEARFGVRLEREPVLLGPPSPAPP